MARRKKLSLLDKIKNVLAIQGLIYVCLKLLQWISTIPILQRIAARYIVKGWLSNWDLHWLIGG